MKRLALVGLIILLVTGCAGTPITPDQKAQYIAQARNILEITNLGVTGADTSFVLLCAADVIPAAECKLGGVAYKTWLNVYASTQDTINQYEAGTITERAIVIKAMSDLAKAAAQTIIDLTGKGSVASIKMRQELVKTQSGLQQLRGVQPCPPCPPARK